MASMTGPYVVGLTGGIGCGKSTAAETLRSMGVFTFDADVLARQAVARGTRAFDAIVSKLGSGILQADGTLNRPLLGRIAFADPNVLKFLEDATHPEIDALAHCEIERARSLGARHVVYEHPLIVEKGIRAEFDAIIVVVAPPEVQVARVMKRNGLTEAEARARLGAQASNADRLAIADYVIDTSKAKEESIACVKRVWGEILARFA